MLHVRRDLSKFDLGRLCDSWQGFAVRDGLLYTPEGTPVTPGEVRAVEWYKQLARELERERKRPLQYVLL